MTFKTLKAEVVRLNLLSTTYFAENVTLTDGTGVTAAAVAKPGPEITQERVTEYGREVVTTREFFLELTAGVPDYVTLGSVRYAVENHEESGGFTILKTKRIGAAEASRENYRRRSP